MYVYTCEVQIANSYRHNHTPTQYHGTSQTECPDFPVSELASAESSALGWAADCRDSITVGAGSVAALYLTFRLERFE